MKKGKYFFCIGIFFAIFLFSCKNQEKEDEKTALSEYIKSNSIKELPKKSGLYYISIDTADTFSADAEYPKKGDTIFVKYKGSLIDNTVFTQVESPQSFIYIEQSAIKGWDEGISYMKKGIIARFIIPSELGYGKYGSGPIPAYSTLIFDVELVDIKKR